MYDRDRQTCDSSFFRHYDFLFILLFPHGLTLLFLLFPRGLTLLLWLFDVIVVGHFVTPIVVLTLFALVVMFVMIKLSMLLSLPVICCSS